MGKNHASQYANFGSLLKNVDCYKNIWIYALLILCLIFFESYFLLNYVHYYLE